MLRRTLALLILTSLAACNEAAKTPRVAPLAAPAKSVAKAEVPRPVQQPTLCDKLTSPELPSIKIEAMKIGAAIALWREALIKVDPSFVQLGFFLPEDDASISLELPAGKAETSLTALLKAYDCDCRKGERHVNIQKEGSVFAEDGAWISAHFSVPAGFLEVIVARQKSKNKQDNKEAVSHEIVCPGVVDSGSSPGPLTTFIQSTNQLFVVIQEKNYVELEKIISDLTPKLMNVRIESVWLRSPRALSAEAGVDLSKLLIERDMEVLSHQELEGGSGLTLVLNSSLRPLARLGEKKLVPVSSGESQATFAAGQGYWTDVLEDSESDQWHDELMVIPRICRDDKTIEIEIKQNLSWQGPVATRVGLKMGVDNKLDASSGDTRILWQETEPDGRHWRIHLLRGSVIKCVPPATACLMRKMPVRELKVQSADTVLLEKLSHPAFAGGAGTLEKALGDWAVKEKIELKNLGVISPEIHFRSCGPLSASMLLSELIFRSPVEAVAKDGAVELRWPPKTKKYKVESSAYLQAMATLP